MSATTVVDLGACNLWNLERALRHLGAEVEVTTDPGRMASARILVLPGVGAFAPARERLRGAPEEALREAVAGGAWLLGICLGFQLLFEGSDEFGATDGLGYLPGRITQLPETVPVPHIGWNQLHDLAAHPLLAGLGDGAADSRPAPSASLGAALPHLFFYFVHSFAPEGVPEELTLARCTHGRAFPAVVGRGRVLGAQFHPERSGASGLRLLSNFLEIAGAPARARSLERASARSSDRREVEP
jgi:glutamine amidotransferase